MGWIFKSIRCLVSWCKGIDSMSAVYQFRQNRTKFWDSRVPKRKKDQINHYDVSQHFWGYFEKMKIMFSDVFQSISLWLQAQSRKLWLLHSLYQKFRISVISIILTANLIPDDLNTVIFVISGSKSTKINVLFLVFLKFCV